MTSFPPGEVAPFDEFDEKDFRDSSSSRYFLCRRPIRAEVFRLSGQDSYAGGLEEGTIVCCVSCPTGTCCKPKKEARKCHVLFVVNKNCPTARLFVDILLRSEVIPCFEVFF